MGINTAQAGVTAYEYVDICALGLEYCGTQGYTLENKTITSLCRKQRFAFSRVIHGGRLD
jgi:putative hemolysin